MSSAYGLGWREFLQEIGLKPRARLRSVSIGPAYPTPRRGSESAIFGSHGRTKTAGL